MTIEKKYPIRKILRTGEYEYSGHTYFITICTKNFIPLFGFIEPSPEPTMILNDLGKYADKLLKKHKQIQHHIVMPNHVHFLATVHENQTSIDQIVRNFKSRMTRYNDGNSLWHKSYYDVVIKDEQHFMNVWTYIEYNAAKWKEDSYYRER